VREPDANDLIAADLGKPQRAIRPGGDVLEITLAL
jgi:hypothetical protein